jgi:hypothetical protein
MKHFFTIIFCFSLSCIIGQQKHTLSGYIKDGATGETLIGANIYNTSNTAQGTVTNSYGFYSLTLESGNYKIVASYLGYEDQVFEVDLTKILSLNISLNEGVVIDEVVITADKDERKKNVEGTQMGTIDIPVENIKKLPAIFGEVDVLKTIQLLPGVLSSGEGNAGFYVRGGGPDQNLVLLDEAVVYNSGHMLGFFSVFNADALKNTTLIKGSMPANYGGQTIFST